METHWLPRLLEECYQEEKGIGKELYEVGFDWGRIFKNLLFRCICCVVFALGIFGLKYNGEGNRNFMYMMYLVFIIVGLSPLRHCRDKVCFHEFGVVYHGLFRKKEYLFAKWKPFVWIKKLTLFGLRYRLGGTGFEFSQFGFELFPFDYTYIKNFRENFLYLYLNNVEIGESRSETKQWPYVDSMEQAMEQIVRSTYQGTDMLEIVYAHYFGHGKTATDSYYIMGIGERDLYVIPFVTGKSNVSYGTGFYYWKRTVVHINDLSYGLTEFQEYQFLDKNKKVLFHFRVHAQNIKRSGNKCLNVKQEERAKKFYEVMAGWIEEVNGKG